LTHQIIKYGLLINFAKNRNRLWQHKKKCDYEEKMEAIQEEKKNQVTPNNA
jgi:hypothetical protein